MYISILRNQFWGTPPPPKSHSFAKRYSYSWVHLFAQLGYIHIFKYVLLARFARPQRLVPLAGRVKIKSGGNTKYHKKYREKSGGKNSYEKIKELFFSIPLIFLKGNLLKTEL